MNTLHRFYIGWLRSVTVTLGFLSASAAVNLPSETAKVLTSGTVLGGLFLASEWFVREKLWRMKWFHRHLDFEGDWLCVTFYEAVETQDNSIRKKFSPHSTFHQARIEQNTRRISIRSSHGRNFTEWQSIMMNLIDNGIEYAYRVDYTGGYTLRGHATGFESLTVRQRESDPKSGKPILLFGTFAHCAEGQPEMFRGAAVFCSSKHLDLIMTDSTMPPRLREGVEKIKHEQSKS